jgi:hypothetical protein
LDERGVCFFVDLECFAFLASFSNDRLLKLVDIMPLPTGVSAPCLRFMGRLRPEGADLVDLALSGKTVFSFPGALRATLPFEVLLFRSVSAEDGRYSVSWSLMLDDLSI